MPKTIPRIGRQDLLKGIEKLAQIVYFHDELTVAELREQMEAINRDRDTKLFKDIDEWLHFTLKDNNTSIEIIEREDNSIELTEEGKHLVTATDFRVAAFELLEEKSQTNFTYFQRALHGLDEKVQASNYDMGTNLTDTVNTLMKDTVSGNKVTAGAIACLLRDFEIVEKDDGRWRIDPAQYTYFRGDEESIVEDIIAQHGNRMDLADLRRMLMMDFKWDEDSVDDVIQRLERQSRVARDRYEGKNVIERLSTES